MHSPFVFEFINEVLRKKAINKDCYAIEEERKRLLNSGKKIIVTDLGAGSRKLTDYKRSVSDIARYSLMKSFNAQILYRMVKKFEPDVILELGTSLGITTNYLAAAKHDAKIITIEGSRAIKEIAEEITENLKHRNIEFLEGNFDDLLPAVLSKCTQVDFAVIDGNHKKQPVLNYFHQIMNSTSNDSIIIIDDIYWSDEMEEAWAEIRNDDRVRVTIDLFYMGIVFLKKELHKEHFILRA